MSLTLIPPERADEWNAFVASSPHGSFLQSYEWGLVKSGTWRPLPAALLDSGGRFLACALLLKRRLPLGKSLLYAPRGPVLREWTEDTARHFFRGVEELARREGAFLVQFDPEIPETDETHAALLKKNDLAYSTENIQPRGTILLDLSPGPDALLASFHHKTRYNIRLAEKKGVTVREENSASGVDVFYGLFRTTAERDRFMILRKSYFLHLWRTLAARGMATIFAAYYEGRPLAAILQTVFGGRMTYLYGASSNEHRNLMPNHLVHWRAIEWAKTRGVHTYDLWGIPANPCEGHPLWGVYRFKKGFCETETRWIGTYQWVRSRFWLAAFTHGAASARTLIRFLRTGRFKGSLEE
jgi:lipid II:glycine glycyltransferase (peptidoglycan interpeptide bridge formation enzyme)